MNASRTLAPVVAAAVAVVTSLGLTVPAVLADNEPYVAVTKPGYESPGGMVPIFVTAWFPPAGY